MRRTIRALLVAFAAVLLLAAPAAGSVPAADAGGGGGGGRVSVASYNLYLGADLTPILQAGSQAELVQRSGEAYQHMVQVDFPSRAQAIARLLARQRPDIVGLQEVSTWERGTLGGATTPTYDYLSLLLDALAQRGLSYYVASTATNFSATMPISATEQAKYTDQDVVLVRNRLGGPRVVGQASGNFAAKLVVPSPTGITFTIPRGWTTADVSLAGRIVRFGNTHLEAYSPQIRSAQAAELVSTLAASPYPVVLVGDLNSDPTDTAGAYGLFAAAGYADSWLTAGEPSDGFTSGQDDDLANVPSQLSRRIDYVLTKGGSAHSVTVIGDRLSDRTPGGLWPSDHAGLVARFCVG
jgi:endonuclease/exonuclease/phosphatase family metal-dependent hydrolase